jgi:hypothetical protein
MMTPGYTMGEKGGEFVTGSAAMTAGRVFRGVQVIQEAVVTVLTVNGVDNIPAILPVTLPVGVYLFGQGVTAFTQTSGLTYLTV